jgi:hypothetical protein
MPLDLPHDTALHAQRRSIPSLAMAWLPSRRKKLAVSDDAQFVSRDCRPVRCLQATTSERGRT